MANKSLFQSYVGKLIGRPETTNAAGGPAYSLKPEHKLAQLAMTGTLSPIFYADARTQLDDVVKAAGEVAPRFLAQTAVYARREGHMKDMPALLLVLLSMRDTELLTRAFPRVIDNGRMLRNFVQIMRSGQIGRKSLGSRPKALVQSWLNAASDGQILRAAVGQSPSLADVIRMVHPKPQTAARAALYAYLIGKPHDAELLPKALKDLEAFKQAPATAPVPDVPFQMLTTLELGPEQWARIGETGGWQMLRMNLNTFARHGAFDVPGFAELAARRLGDEGEIARSRVLPYQLLAAYMAARSSVPREVAEALQNAMEIATRNVPEIEGRVVVAPDVSGSMNSPVTGFRKGASTAVRCVDVAGLTAAAILRANPKAEVLPFAEDVVNVPLNPRDTVMTNAEKLADVCGAGTNCAAPLARLNAQNAKVDVVIMVSDNQSWLHANPGSATATLKEWLALKARCPEARLVCIDIQPYGTTQAPERDDVLNVGGFSDEVFEVVADYAAGRLDTGRWVARIEEIEL